MPLIFFFWLLTCTAFHNLAALTLKPVVGLFALGVISRRRTKGLFVLLDIENNLGHINVPAFSDLTLLKFEGKVCPSVSCDSRPFGLLTATQTNDLTTER